MSKRKEHTRHHYIPQCYLRNFTEDGKCVWVYDKARSKSYHTAISSICYKDDFYKIEKESLPQTNEKINELTIETEFFAIGIEKYYSQLLCEIITAIDEAISVGDIPRTIIDRSVKQALSKQIAIQFLRLPEVREAQENMQKVISQSVGNFLRRNRLYDTDGAKKVLKQVEIPQDPVLNHCLVGYGNENLVNEFANKLCNNYWNIYVTTGDYFYTSDFPISVEPYVGGVQEECMGLAQYGGVVTFPISKKILLKIMDCRYFSDYGESDGRCFIAEPMFVRQENIRQYLYAREIVVSANNNLSFLSFIKQINGNEVSEHPNYGFSSNWI